MDEQNQNNQQNQDEQMARENLKAVLQVGMTVQMVSVAVTFAIKKGKEDFLRKLNDLLKEMTESLSEEEKKELREDTDVMIQTKAQELVASLGKDLEGEELEKALEELKLVTGIEKNQSN